MPRFTKLAGTFAAMVVALMWIAPAQAQATRTWVSGVGDDANPCSRTAPCKTFAGTMPKTAAGGEINCLDPNSVGTVTITKSMAIICNYTEAGLLTNAGNAMIVNGAGAIVFLKGLDFEGLGTAANGISFVQGAALHVDDCVIRGFGGGTASGIAFTPSSNARLYVSNTVVANNGTGAVGGGIVIHSTATGQSFATLKNVRAEQNASSGILIDGTGTTHPTAVTITGSAVSGSTGNGILAISPVGASGIDLLVDTTTSVNNLAAGLKVDGSLVTGVLGSSNFAGNNIGVASANSGAVFTNGTNKVTLNVLGSAATSVLPPY